VAVGAEALESVRCLLEFYGAAPTREGLKLAVSTGNLELIRLMWERLPEEHEHRFDLMNVAADFHREEPLAWLLRGATNIEGEVIIEVALEQRWTDAVLIALASGVASWTDRARALAAAWPAAASADPGPNESRDRVLDL
jgi:hypothetical protein